MSTSSGWRDWIRSADPLAVRVVVVGFFAALAYGAVLVAQGVVHPEGTATLRADTDDYVVVITGGGPVDGLVARSLGDATLAVPRTGGLEPLVADVRRLSPTRVLVLGGPDAVGADALAALTAGTSASVTRLAGPDRYETAARAALSAFPTPVDEVLVVRSDAAADAEGPPGPAGRCLPPGGPCSADPSRPVQDGVPVLLVTGDALPAVTARALQQLRPQRLTVVGAVSSAVLEDLRSVVSSAVTSASKAGPAGELT